MTASRSGYYPRCMICGRGVVAGQTDAEDQPCHLSCQLAPKVTTK